MDEKKRRKMNPRTATFGHKATVKIGGKTILETEKAVSLEGNFYFPVSEDFAKMLTESSRTYRCPWKGFANYYDVDGVKNAGWIYHEPKEEAAAIAGMIAFDPELVEVSGE